ncbi:MAG: DUF4277 domain-containing protein [Desulfobacterales bacterium]
MMATKIQRIDTIPLIVAMLTKMNVAPVIDSAFTAHSNWCGLSYGQLAVLFITYVLHSLTHRFPGMEAWVNQHHAVIERATGRQMGEKDATDDRLGRLAQVLGESEQGMSECQRRLGQGIISAYRLPTKSSGTTPPVSMSTMTRKTKRTACWRSATAKTTARICCSSNKAWPPWTRPAFRC